MLDVQIGGGKGPGTKPLALEVREFEGNTGKCYVTIYDRFQTNFKITYLTPEGAGAGAKPAEKK